MEGAGAGAWGPRRRPARSDRVLFCTKQFILFFLIVLTTYWALPWRRARVYLLLAASFYFYASWNRQLACLICFSTVLDFLIGLVLDRPALAAVWRRALLALSVTANLGMLCYFKYANFFLRSLEDGLHACGASASLPVLRVILPIGISFYTFEAISYTVDVYRRRIRAETSLANFLLFVLFFPHLVAGPIVRARDFLPQARCRKQWSWARAGVGLALIALGAFKKLALADRIPAYVDPVFTNPGAHASGTLWLAALGHACQVYCDFSGYSDLALGCAHLLGYKLTLNFNMPFLSVNVSELWRRWHISLSSWLRDYFFIPIGGSRRGNWATCRNLLLTMGLAGLWHGASWNNVLFGLTHGMMLCVHRFFRGWAEGRPLLNQALLSGPGTALRIAFTFLCFCAALVIFRMPEVLPGLAMLGRMFAFQGGLSLPLAPHGLWAIFAALGVGHALGAWAPRWRLPARVPAPAWGLALGCLFTAALVLAPDASKAFVYFQF
jgi:alginate O-acetyltransferase complex protein AlgI